MFPLLDFLLPPGEENRGKGLHRGKEEDFPDLHPPLKKGDRGRFF
jgi:hypothetical protein